MREYEIEESNKKELYVTLYTKLRHEPTTYDVTVRYSDDNKKRAMEIEIKSSLAGKVTLHPAHLEILHILQKEGYIPNF